MQSEVLLNDKSWEKLYNLDKEEAQRVKKRNCLDCGGKLDSSNYLRKPRGFETQKRFEVRFSFCCRNCRKRHTPKSLRFLGRKVYWFFVVVLSSYQVEQRQESIFKLSNLLRLCERTLCRWIWQWNSRVAFSSIWKKLKGLLQLPLLGDKFITELWSHFELSEDKLETKILHLLNFLSPLSLNYEYPS